MSALIFTLKNQPKFTLDAAPLTPENLEGKTLTQIKNLKIIYGNKTSKLDTLFTVERYRLVTDNYRKQHR